MSGRNFIAGLRIGRRSSSFNPKVAAAEDSKSGCGYPPGMMLGVKMRETAPRVFYATDQGLSKGLFIFVFLMKP